MNDLVANCESEFEVKLVDLERASLGVEVQLLWCDPVFTLNACCRY